MLSLLSTHSNSVPVIACQKISSATGKHLPFFTVVTDLGSCHFTWFDKGVEKMFIASDQIRGLAERKEVPKEKIVMSGLPIRKDFATEAERLGQGGRTSVQGKIYQMQVRDQLGLIREQQSNLDPSMDRHRVLLVMGGGEGVGSLSDIVDSLFLELAHRKIMATIIVVCGRNEKLKNSLEKRDWNEMLYAIQARNEKSNLLNGIASLPLSVFHKLHIGKRSQNGEEKKDDERPEERSQVLVHPLGFVTNMAEYMVAADVLITKAGPGTIAEAASVGLPVMLTSFLPGQEEGNVDFVINHKFGDFKSDNDPPTIAKTVGRWLKESSRNLLTEMSIHAKQAGSPNAAEEIVRNIGTSVYRWKEFHPEEPEEETEIISNMRLLNKSVSQVSC